MEHTLCERIRENQCTLCYFKVLLVHSLCERNTRNFNVLFSFSYIHSVSLFRWCNMWKELVTLICFYFNINSSIRLFVLSFICSHSYSCIFHPFIHLSVLSYKAPIFVFNCYLSHTQNVYALQSVRIQIDQT